MRSGIFLKLIFVGNQVIEIYSFSVPPVPLTLREVSCLTLASLLYTINTFHMH